MSEAGEAAGLAERFAALTGRRPEGIWQAPGRVNLIGDHTDYSGGWALPFAIDRRTYVAARRRPDGTTRCWSEAFPGPAVEVASSRLESSAPMPSWARYPLGVLWTLGGAGAALPGLDVLITTTLPLGGGLASSASVEVAIALAATGLAERELPRRDLAVACHRAESEFVGAPTGLLDQLAVLEASAGAALLIDFEAVATSAVPLGVGPLVVVDTGVRHDHVAGQYRDRRRSCGEAATLLGLSELGRADQALVGQATADGRLVGSLARRARHVVSENERVRRAAGRLVAGESIGSLLLESHRSLRDDFAVSWPAADRVVEMAVALGAEGARMTGGGFGGSCVVLGLPDAVLEPALASAFLAAGWPAPAVFEVTAVAGAGRVA